ncbi:MAG: hypothetical protein AB1540_10055 [Bdellovibrionota bacterium]
MTLDELIALGGDLVAERKKLSESLRKLERTLEGSASSALIKALGVAQLQDLHLELDQLSTGIDRFGSLSKCLLEQLVTDKLESCATLFEESKKRIEALAQKLGRNVNVECKPSAARLDRRLLERFGPIFLEMLDVFVEYSIESSKERSARKKRPIAYMQLEVRESEKGFQLRVICDGNGILPPLSDLSGLALAKLGVRVSFEGKPGKWSAWLFSLPACAGEVPCLPVKVGQRKVYVPAWAVLSIREFPRALSESLVTEDSEIWMLSRDLERIRTLPGMPFAEPEGPRHLIELGAGTETIRYAVASTHAVQEIFILPIDSALSGSGRLLGVYVDESAQSELGLVLNPAYLVYGDLKSGVSHAS